MYAVIFKAEINELAANDADLYAQMVKELRKLVMQKYACIEFSSVL